MWQIDGIKNEIDGIKKEINGIKTKIDGINFVFNPINFRISPINFPFAPMPSVLLSHHCAVSPRICLPFSPYSAHLGGDIGDYGKIAGRASRFMRSVR